MYMYEYIKKICKRSTVCREIRLNNLFSSPVIEEKWSLIFQNTVVNFGKTRDFSLKIRILKIFSRPTMCSNAKQRNWTFLPRRDFFNSEELSRIKSSPLGMSTFRFFVNEHFGVFLSLRKKMYFVLFSFLNSKKSKDSFIVY